MRAFYLALCGMALAFVCASPALADYAQSQAWFGKLDTNARFDIQTDLIFLGDYTGLIDGKFGNVTYAAVTKYQQSLNVETTGILTADDQDALHGKAKAIADGMGVKVVKESRSQLALAVPEKLLTGQTNTRRGMRFSSSDGGIVLETISKPLKEQSFHDLYLSLSTPSAARKISYSMIDVARFIVSATLNGRAFYTMFYAAPDASIGFSMSWDDSYSQQGSLLSIFTASSAIPIASMAPDDGEQSAPPPVSNNFGAFLTVEDVPQAIILNGQINPGTPLDFRRALKAHPDAKILVLNSPGGDVDAALMVAHQVHDTGMSTFISKNMICASACSYIYFAGPQREDDGKLGVHQVSSDTPDLVQAQTALSDILDALKEFGVPQDVISVMLRTPPSDVHVFDPKEVADLGINQGAPLADPLAPPTPAETPSTSADATSSDGLTNHKVRTLRVNPDGSVGTPAGTTPAPAAPTAPAPTAPPEPAVPAPQTAPTQSAPLVGGTVNSTIILEERSADGQAIGTFTGTISWSKDVDQTNVPELVGTASVPERGLAVSLIIARNPDPRSQASRVIAVDFGLSGSFAGRGIADIQSLSMKHEELGTATPLPGLVDKLGPTSFLFLSAGGKSNIDLLTNNRWAELELSYASGAKASLTAGLGPLHSIIFDTVFAAWAKLDAAPATATAPAPAASPATGPKLQSLSGVTGTCKTLRLAGRDVTAACSGTLMLSAYTDGRIGFYSTQADGTTMTFSGATTRRHDANTQVTTLDQLILGGGGQPPVSEPVTGACTYGNPYNGPSSVDCEAEDGTGNSFVLKFTTDGRPPKFMH